MPLFGRRPDIPALTVKRDINGLVRVLQSKAAGDVRRKAAEALGQIGDKRAYAALSAALNDSDAGVRAGAAQAIGSIGRVQVAKQHAAPRVEDENAKIIPLGMAMARGEVEKTSKLYLNPASPHNQRVFAYLHIQKPDQTALCYPDEADIMGLNTHPDLVYYLWGLGRSSACVILYPSRPVLVHNISGVIFGLALGTSLLALRLPELERGQMLAKSWWNGMGSGAALNTPASEKAPAQTFPVSDIGEDWVFLQPYEKGNSKLCPIAMAYAEGLR